jgi:hypothetical protein
MNKIKSIALGVVVLATVRPGTCQTLAGAVDLHVHADPDSVPRSIDAIGVARLARERGMRALVLKNHYESTASLAWIVRQQVTGIEVFGGIALNRSVGGVNPAAVERMTRVKGGWGRLVWMPTFDAENQVRVSGEQRPFVAVSRGGEPTPEVREVLAVAARSGLTVATGHSSPAEVRMLIREARRAGVARVVVTHAMLAPVSMTIGEMKEAAAAGAWIEFVYNALIGPEKALGIDDYARAIRAVGIERCVLASDLGQAGNPLHPDGLLAFYRALASRGFTAEEIDRMAKVNPARVLGLD